MGGDEVKKILDAISASEASMHGQIGLIGVKIDRVEQKVDEMHTDFDIRFDNVNDKIAKITDQVEKNTDDVASINWRLNELQQLSLAAKMDITGVEESRLDGDVKSVVISVIESFGIAIQPTDIIAAFTRKPKGLDKTIITAIFSSADRKSEVMKLKFANKKHTNIYFAHTMTPETRTIFMRARVMAKSTGAKTVYVAGGKVVVAYEGGKKIWVTEADIAGHVLPEKRAVTAVTDGEPMLQ